MNNDDGKSFVFKRIKIAIIVQKPFHFKCILRKVTYKRSMTL